jgi:hypothetical protein
MRPIFFSVCLVLLAGLIQTPTVFGDTPSFATNSPAETIHVGSNDVKIHYGSHLIYVIGKNPDRASERVGMPELNYLVKFRLPVEFKGHLAVNNNLVKIDGKTMKVIFASSAPKIMTVENGDALKDNEGLEDSYGAGVIKLWGEGDVTLTATCGDASAKIAFHVARIPVNDECGKDKLIEALGLPDKQAKTYIEWPDDKVIDGIVYVTHHGDDLTVEHWQYDKYPGAIFELSGGDLVPFVKQASWEDISLTYFELDHSDQN